MAYTIEIRRNVTVNTDPQRRCYNGCHFRSEIVKTPWETFELNISEDDIDRRIVFWRELNDYAVAQRGKSAQVEYRIIPSK